MMGEIPKSPVRGGLELWMDGQDERMPPLTLQREIVPVENAFEPVCSGVVCAFFFFVTEFCI